ncbi:MAG: porin [Gemmatimonadales bacterium]
MHSVLGRAAVVCGAAISLYAPQARAQVEIHSRAAEITLAGRVHTQLASTSVSGERASEFFVRRARLTAELEVNDWVSGKIQPDYGEGKIALKDAYFRLTFAPELRATIGQFKRPFDLFELTSSTRILVVERTGGVAGVDACAGPGGVCTLSRFTEKLGYSDRDIGVMFDGRAAGRVRYMAAVTNGAGANVADENGARSFSGRVGVSLADDITLAGNVGVHDYVNPNVGDEYATAFGGDLEIGDYTQGIHFQAGLVAGDNWRNLANDAPTTFVTFQGILTYRMPIGGNRYLSAIEPVGRVSWGDPDTDGADDHGILLTPGLVFHITGRNKIGANVDVWSPAAGDTEWSLKVQSYLHF